ncbi:MAG: acyltransferase [Salinivirgaceae bacterium]|nr:acyltransferase [Salinivirgaceae bacterium]
MSVQDTNALKGLALILMLIHHLFYKQNGLFDDIHIWGDHYLFNEFGIFAKICVSIFVFLSGYGLMVQTDQKDSIGSLTVFYFHRFKKLFMNYWFIWIIFVPISYLCFGLTFQNAYQSDVCWHLITDVLGVHSLIFNDVYCYNPTWWFYSCIIVLYLLFPIMYKSIKNDPLPIILLTLIVSFLPIPFIDVIRFYIVAFALGMWLATQKSLQMKSKWIFLILALLYAVGRNTNSYPIMIDCLLTLIVVQLYRSIKWPDLLIRVMAFIGRHSMNIFLFHTFIFHFWYKDFIYISRIPIIILFTLLSICLIISILLEWLKKYTIYRI